MSEAAAYDKSSKDIWKPYGASAGEGNKTVGNGVTRADHRRDMGDGTP